MFCGDCPHNPNSKIKDINGYSEQRISYLLTTSLQYFTCTNGYTLMDFLHIYIGFPTNVPWAIDRIAIVNPNLVEPQSFLSGLSSIELVTFISSARTIEWDL